MLDQTLREYKDYPFKILPKSITSKISPNIVTLVAFGVAAICIYFIIKGNFTLGLLFWIINRIVDGLDGHIARTNNKKTDFGGFLDTSLDLLTYAGIICAFSFVFATSSSIVITGVLLIALFYVNIGQLFMLSAIIEKQNKKLMHMTTLYMPISIVEGFETILLYSLFFIFPEKILELWTLFIILMILNIFQRFYWAIKYVK